MNKGTGQYCLPGDAVYQLELFGCHGYADPIIRWEVGQDSLMLTAVSHELTAYILSTEIVDDLYVAIYTNGDSTLKNRYGLVWFWFPLPPPSPLTENIYPLLMEDNSQVRTAENHPE